MLSKLIAPLSLRALAIIVAVILLGAFLFIRSCSDGRQAAEQGKQDSRSSEALAETAKDAAATVIAQAEDEASVDDLVAATIEEIDNAPTEQAAGDAARAAICRMPDYRDDPACRVQPVHPR